LLKADNRRRARRIESTKNDAKRSHANRCEGEAWRGRWRHRPVCSSAGRAASAGIVPSNTVGKCPADVDAERLEGDDFDMGASLSSTMSSSSKAIPQPLRRKRTQAARQRQPTVLWFARRTVAASTVVFNAPDVSGLGTVFPVFKWVNYAARSNSPSIAHLPRDHSIFRDPRCRKACPCRKRICREPSPTHERNQISRHIP
jgi:hypothetical protein